MAITAPLLKVDSTILSELATYKVGAGQKLWTNSERNMLGKVTGTLIGIFPKLEITFRNHLNQQQVSQICTLLNKPFFNVDYYDPEADAVKSASYYASDFYVELADKKRGLYKEFPVSLVPVGPRS